MSFHPSFDRMVGEIQNLFRYLSPEERLEFLKRITIGYCEHCGYALTPHRPRCDCTNDD